MSECCCYPSVDSDLYNPAELRLYGHAREIGSQDLYKRLAKVSQSSKEFSSDEKAFVERNFVGQKDSQRSILTVSVGGGEKRYAVSILDPSTESTQQPIQSVGVIYGYAFEGHCYQLPKATIMLLPGPPQEIKDGTDDCGYTKKLGYSVWTIDKLARVVILDVRTDDLKTLVLDANTPGNRSPLAYSQHQALAPQRNRD